jgi:hypothetical protein
VEVRHFWLREKVNEGIFSMERVSTEENIADIGTKPLAAKQFTVLRDKLVVKNYSKPRKPKRLKTRRPSVNSRTSSIEKAS